MDTSFCFAVYVFDLYSTIIRLVTVIDSNSIFTGALFLLSPTLFQFLITINGYIRLTRGNKTASQ